MYHTLQVYPAAQDCASPAGQLPKVMQFEAHPDVSPFTGFLAPLGSSVIQIEREETRDVDGGAGVPDLMIRRTPPGRLTHSYVTRPLYYVCDTTSGYCVALTLFSRFFVNGKKIASEASETFVFWTAERDTIRGYIRQFVGRTRNPTYTEDISAWWVVFDLETRLVCKVDEMSVALPEDLKE